MLDFKDKNILIIGDSMLDKYIYGIVDRISPEAPVPILKVTEEKYMPGGAANVARNIVSLGAQASLISLVGFDPNGLILRNALEALKIDTSQCIAGRPTTVKARIESMNQQMLRVDRETDRPLNEKIHTEIIEWLKANINRYNAVIISDYGKGMLKGLCEFIIEICNANNKPVLIDPKPEYYLSYKGATVITPNLKETKEMASHVPGVHLGDYFQLKALLITKGQDGMRLEQHDKSAIDIDTKAKEVYDVSGAGDTVIATMALCLAIGLDYLKAAQMANIAASIVVGKVGTSAIKIKELHEKIKMEDKNDLEVK